MLHSAHRDLHNLSVISPPIHPRIKAWYNWGTLLAVCTRVWSRFHQLIPYFYTWSTTSDYHSLVQSTRLVRSTMPKSGICSASTRKKFSNTYRAGFSAALNSPSALAASLTPSKKLSSRTASFKINWTSHVCSKITQMRPLSLSLRQASIEICQALRTATVAKGSMNKLEMKTGSLHYYAMACSLLPLVCRLYSINQAVEINAAT